MKRWVFWGVAAAIALVIIGLFVLYSIARSGITEDLQQAEEIMKSHEEVESVQDVHYYNGNEAVYTGEAVNTSGVPVWVFVKEGEVVNTLRKDNSLTFEEATKQMKEKFSLQTLRSVKPGIEQGDMIYEVTFDKDGRLHFYYMSMEDGTFIKRYSVKKT